MNQHPAQISGIFHIHLLREWEGQVANKAIGQTGFYIFLNGNLCITTEIQVREEFEFFLLVEMP